MINRDFILKLADNKRKELIAKFGEAKASFENEKHYKTFKIYFEGNAVGGKKLYEELESKFFGDTITDEEEKILRQIRKDLKAIYEIKVKE